MDPFNGMDPLDNFYTDHPCVDWYKTTEDIRNIFQRGSVFGLHDYQFWECLFTHMLSKKLIVYEQLDLKRLGIHSFFLSKNQKLCL